jgi:hypothetical protein
MGYHPVIRFWIPPFDFLVLLFKHSPYLLVDELVIPRSPLPRHQNQFKIEGFKFEFSIFTQFWAHACLESYWYRQ